MLAVDSIYISYLSMNTRLYIHILLIHEYQSTELLPVVYFLWRAQQYALTYLISFVKDDAAVSEVGLHQH